MEFKNVEPEKPTTAGVVITMSPEDAAEFKRLIERGLNK